MLSPQLSQTRHEWFPLARGLAQQGYRALSIDSAGVDIDGEVLRAAQFLRKQGARMVFAIGASKGGTAVLAAASHPALISGAIAVSPVVSFGDVTLSRRSIASLEIPALVIVDEADSAVVDADQLAKWGRAALRVIHLNADGAHGTEYFGSRREQEFVRTIEAFLDHARRRSGSQ